MKNRITLSLLSIVSLSTNASPYVVLIDSNHNDYEIGGVEYSEWTQVSEECITDITESDVYFNYTEKQNKSCVATEERTKTITRSDGSKLVETESRVLPETTTEIIITGTHKESSCSNIVSTKYDNGDGYYVISNSRIEQNVFCDMEEGGWTLFLIAIDNQTDWQNINWNYGHTPNMIPTNSYSDLEAICQNAVGIPTYADYTSSSNKYWYVAREFLNNETNFFAAHQSKGDGGGIALGLKNLGSNNWVTLQGTATTFPPVSDVTDSPGDNCTASQELCGFWDWMDYVPGYGYGAGAEDWAWTQTEGVLCGGKW